MDVIGVAADHGGFELKEKIKSLLGSQGIQIKDYGAFTLNDQDDFPDVIAPLASDVGLGNVTKGIAFCGSGVGACIVANKYTGVFACLINETYSAHQGVEHDNMNLLCLGGRVTGEALAEEIIRAFLKASYLGTGRYKRRVDKIINIDKNHYGK